MCTAYNFKVNLYYIQGHFGVVTLLVETYLYSKYKILHETYLYSNTKHRINVKARSLKQPLNYSSAMMQ